MSDFFSKRLKREKKELNIKQRPIIEISETDEPFVEEIKTPAITPERLKEKLLNKLNIKIKTVMNEENNPQTIELVHFSCLDEFVVWYEKNKSFFSENQQKPLNTLVESRNMTLGGCGCNRQQRKNIANQYFINFWINNKETDLLPTLTKVLNTKKVIFGDFLTYP